MMMLKFSFLLGLNATKRSHSGDYFLVLFAYSLAFSLHVSLDPVRETFFLFSHY